MFADEPGRMDFNPKIYRQDKEWEPEAVSEEIEQALNEMECKLEQHIKNHKYYRTINLTRNQHDMIRRLRHNEDFIIVPSNKNLGPCILEREEYIARALQDHLLQEKSYRQLQKDEDWHLFETTRREMIKITMRARALNQLSDNEYTFLTRGTRDNNEMARFYIMPKVHKSTEEDPTWKTRPVTSTCGGPLATASIFLDYKLQLLTQFLPAYCKNWRSLVDDLIELGQLPTNARIFTADATSMYTNICTDHGLRVVNKWITKILDEKKILASDYPKDLILDLLSLVMKNNVFTFGDTF